MYVYMHIYTHLIKSSVTRVPNSFQKYIAYYIITFMCICVLICKVLFNHIIFTSP